MDVEDPQSIIEVRSEGTPPASRLSDRGGSLLSRALRSGSFRRRRRARNDCSCRSRRILPVRRQRHVADFVEKSTFHRDTARTCRRGAVSARESAPPVAEHQGLEENVSPVIAAQFSARKGLSARGAVLENGKVGNPSLPVAVLLVISTGTSWAAIRRPMALLHFAHCRAGADECLSASTSKPASSATAG